MTEFKVNDCPMCGSKEVDHVNGSPYGDGWSASAWCEECEFCVTDHDELDLEKGAGKTWNAMKGKGDALAYNVAEARNTLDYCSKRFDAVKAELDEALVAQMKHEGKLRR